MITDQYGTEEQNDDGPKAKKNAEKSVGIIRKI